MTDFEKQVLEHLKWHRGFCDKNDWSGWVLTGFCCLGCLALILGEIGIFPIF